MVSKISPSKQLVMLLLFDYKVELCWDSNDILQDVSVGCIWDSLRPHAPRVALFKVVWFSQSIPKHAFVMWLLMGELLKTQDKLKSWNLHANLVLKCFFCNDSVVSHEHLFFKCAFSSKVWRSVLAFIHVNTESDDWKVCRDVLIPIVGRNSSRVVAKLCFAATVYYIWHERNIRLFRGIRICILGIARPNNIDGLNPLGFN
ncbi:uncharacterized protein [Rutidosis leptorrhynchoides]|uniref:uncharacterized protein n=1 Tax=Rutidosis leptorrhynchoides TaxID=125765 RepID=UPI003A99A680